MACLAAQVLSVEVGFFMNRPKASISCGSSDLSPASRARSAALAATRLLLFCRNFANSPAAVAPPTPLRALRPDSVCSTDRLLDIAGRTTSYQPRASIARQAREREAPSGPFPPLPVLRSAMSEVESERAGVRAGAA